MTATEEVILQVKTALQYDYDVTSTVTGGVGSETGLAVTHEANSLLAVYFIQGNSIFSAYQDPESTGNASPAWIVEDTNFRKHVAIPCLPTCDLNCLTSSLYRSPHYPPNILR